MRRVLVLAPVARPLGGGEAVVAWTLQALQDIYRVTLLTWEPPDLLGMNRIYGTRLDPSRFTVIRAPRVMHRLVGLDPDPLSIYPLIILWRIARWIGHRYAAVLHLHGEANLGRRAIQYVHYPHIAEKVTVPIAVVVDDENAAGRDVRVEMRELVPGRLVPIGVEPQQGNGHHAAASPDTALDEGSWDPVANDVANRADQGPDARQARARVRLHGPGDAAIDCRHQVERRLEYRLLVPPLDDPPQVEPEAAGEALESSSQGHDLRSYLDGARSSMPVAEAAENPTAGAQIATALQPMHEPEHGQAQLLIDAEGAMPSGTPASAEIERKERLPVTRFTPRLVGSGEVGDLGAAVGVQQLGRRVSTEITDRQHGAQRGTARRTAATRSRIAGDSPAAESRFAHP